MLAEDGAKDGLSQLIEDAKRDGSTVIVVRPGQDDKAAPDTSMFDAQRALKIRERVRQILALTPQLPETLGKVLSAEMGPKGGKGWLYNGLFNAALGLGIAWVIMRSVIQATRRRFSHMHHAEPHTAADKVRYLLFRALMSALFALGFVVIAGIIAILLHNGDPRTRIVTVEIIIAYAIYRMLRYGVSWNLLAYDAPKHRLVNLSDEEAKRMHLHWWVMVALVLVATAITRFFVLIGFNSGNGEFNGNGLLSLGEAQLLYIFNAGFAVSMLILITVINWRALSHVVAPSSAGMAFYKARTNLARLVPPFIVIYAIAAFVMFTWRVASLQPNAGAFIIGPFVVSYAALIAQGVALLVIQLLYQRREQKFYERQAMELERQREQAAIAAAAMRADYDGEEEDDVIPPQEGEEMLVAEAGAPPAEEAEVQFEYQPLLRGLIERSVGAIVIVFALGELGRIWGIDVMAQNNWWASFLDIILVSALGWFAYRAVGLFVDRRMEAEGGMPTEDAGEGEGGGAGASRMATLLPIVRYVLISIIVSIALMIVLSELGVDIGPLFAGAGVVGIAVGFGSQKLIQDMFSGAFFLLDDAFRRGEYVEIEGIKGTVEKISVRSFQLRHHLGALHTLPFGEIKQLTNYSRDWVLMKLPLRVTYDTDTEKVRKLVKKLGQQLLDHPQVGHTFMQPLKSQGVYKMEDSAMIIRVKFMTKPGEQFVTRKVVYESIQDLFAREGIHFAHKEVTVRLAEDANSDRLNEEEKKAVTAAARSVIDAEEEAMAAAGGKGDGGGR
ncbi:MscS mechanosensitive ion channel [Ahrensia sp. R2A130]|nr:MscS mechanosensitive ion channel [Ahrensia sp. R2A130]